MELSPQSVASTTFKTVKKGYDPDEVRAYLTRLATSIEATQTQAAAMEARARAAVARLQELAGQSTAQPAAGQQTAGQPTATPVTEPDTASDEAKTISRTLLLAQRTADATIAEAEADARKIRDEAEEAARNAVDHARDEQVRMVEEAKVEARRASEDQRVQIDGEVQSLLARREFLLSDVEHLEQHVITHRNRLREVAASLNTIVDSGVSGLADLRRPLMSAVTEPTPEHADGSDSIDPSVDDDESEERLDPTMPIVRVPSVDEVTDDADEPTVDMTPHAGTVTPDDPR